MDTVNIKIGDRVLNNIDHLKFRNADNENEFLNFQYTPDPPAPELGKVLFVDCDGSVLDTWEQPDVNIMDALPDIPTHQYLVSQGWNWTLPEIKSYMNKYQDAYLTVGAVYDTIDGLTSIVINLTESTGLLFEFGGYREMTIDWGDGTVTTNVSSHAYASYGKYVIKHAGIWYNINGNKSMIVGVHIGSLEVNCTSYNLVYDSTNLEKFSIADGCGGIGSGFNMMSIRTPKAVILPRSIEYIPGSFLSNGLNDANTHIEYVSLSPNFKYVGYYTTDSQYFPQFNGLKIQSISFPEGCNLYPNYNSYCMNANTYLEKINLPESFTTIPSNFLKYATKLEKIYFPYVTTINWNDTLWFYNMINLKYLSLPNAETIINMPSSTQYVEMFNLENSTGLPIVEYIDLHNLNLVPCPYLPKLIYPLKTFLFPKGTISLHTYGMGIQMAREVLLPQNLQSIGSGYFNYSPAKYIKFPPSLNYIGTNSFIQISGMTMDFRDHESIPVSDSTFIWVATLKIIVPDDLYDDWIVATNWCILAEYFVKASEVEDE